MFEHLVVMQWKIITIFMLFHPSLSFSPIRNGLNGAYFRVSAHHFPPYQVLTHGANETFRYVGSTPNVIYWMAEKFNFTYTFFPVDSAESAKLGSVQAGLNQLIKKEVDISTLCIVPTLERTQHMEFSYPVAIESFKLLVPKPGEESRLFGPVRPFQYSTWGCLLISLISVLVVFTVFAWYYSCWNSLPTDHGHGAWEILSAKLGNYTMYIASTCTNQGQAINVPQHSFRILAGVWLLAATVLVNCYSGTLMSSLTLTKFKATINSLEDLAASKELTMTASANSVMAETMLNAHSSALKAIGNAMRQKPDSIFLTPEKGLHNIFSLKYAFPTVESYTSYLINIDLRRKGECRFHVTDRVPITELYTFGLQKGNKFNQLFSEKLQYLWETGLMIYWLKNNLQLSVDKCLVKNKDSARQRAIKLVDLTSAFFILGIGIGFALSSFVIEVVYFHLQRRQSLKFLKFTTGKLPK
ncbi:glutamate receptor ionotropic, delta-2-like [Daphnia carinata]|uniref:glutamate receptor ionotropic, delta-2-like n=1 Tax=Daphnia carinata TaxID=120202 RepID=UPI002868A83E|nr:glutamate receptor ionotropic, delta-2-like [Daphnia carinata]